MFVSPPPITNIESLSQSTISSLYGGSFDKNRFDVNIQHLTISEEADIDTVMAYNKDLDTTPPHYILNMFSAAHLLSRSSYD